MGNIGNELIWAVERRSVKEAARRALEKCKKLERQQTEEGYRIVKVGNMSYLSVPCDKNGNPTAEGLEKIRRLKKHLGI